MSYELYMDNANTLSNIDSILEMLKTSTLTSQKYLELKTKESTHVKPIKKKKIPKEKSIHEDSLFWCFYILWKGQNEYNVITSSYFKIENECKYMIASQLGSYKAIIKQFRISYSDIENSLINEKKISLGCFMVLCCIYKINVIVVNKQFYLAGLTHNLENDTVNIILNKNEVYTIDYSTTLTPTYITNNFIEMHSSSKILKCVSAYKLQELQDMCFRLNIDINQPSGKKKTKTELYTEINVFLNN